MFSFHFSGSRLKIEFLNLNSVTCHLMSVGYIVQFDSLTQIRHRHFQIRRAAIVILVQQKTKVSLNLFFIKFLS